MGDAGFFAVGAPIGNGGRTAHTTHRLTSSGITIPLVLFSCCALLVVALSLVQEASSQSAGPMDMLPLIPPDMFIDFLFGLVACFIGMALAIIALACSRMGLPGAAAVGWFAVFALAGGLWCVFDPALILTLIPYPRTVYTVSALCQHALVLALMGYIRSCSDGHVSSVASILIAVLSALVFLETLVQLFDGPTLFEFSIVVIVVQAIGFIVLGIVMVVDVRKGAVSVGEYRGLVVLLPCIAGLLVEAIVYLSGIKQGGPWFGIGFS